MANTWMNKDNLYLKFGPTKAVPTQAGEYKTFGSQREIEIVLILKNLTSSAVIQNDVISIPAVTGTGDDAAGAFIEQVDLEVLEGASTGSSPTLSIGTIKVSDRTTAVSDTSFVNALAASTIDTAGKKVTLVQGTTGYGSLIGTYLTAANGTCNISAKYGTAAFTTGVIKVRIKYNVALLSTALTPFG